MSKILNINTGIKGPMTQRLLKVEIPVPALGKELENWGELRGLLQLKFTICR
jgi:hypothetical protein